MAVLTIFSATAAFSQTIDFDGEKPGARPAGWIAGATGGGTPKWVVEADPTAPSRPNVLKQTGKGAFPWIVVEKLAIADGFVEVKFKPISGNEDQAGGVVWRWKDGNNYYVARANALEDNVSLYYTANGRRNTLKYVDARVPGNVWNTLRVEFAGERISVSLNGRTCLEYRDSHIAGPGTVGVWTKADSVTAFDDFHYGSITSPK